MGRSGSRAAACLRLPRLSRPAGAGRAPCGRGRRCAGAGADRRRQEHLLPGPGVVPARDGGGDFAAHRADGRSGGGAAAARRVGRCPAFRSGSGRGAQRHARSARAAAGPAVRLAGTFAWQRHAGAAVAAATRAVRDRRGALRVAVGARVPTGVSRAGVPRGSVSRCAAHRIDRDGRSAHTRRHPARAADGGGADVRRQLPSSEPAHRRRSKGGRDRAAFRSAAHAIPVSAASSIAARARRPNALPRS